VRLEWYVSPGLDDMDPLAEPAWDGTDPWRLSDTNFELDVNGMPDPTMPRFVDDNAYVAGSVLVASLGGSQPEIAFSGTNSFFKLRFTGTTMSATLVPDGNGWKLTEGTIAGRIAEPDLFAAFSSFREGAFFICSDQALYQTTKQAMCAARDIHASIASPATPCDALSFGIGFTADPALRGVISPSADPMPICMPAVDPINDSCALGAGGAGGN
jgi:hypothetical protein